MIKKCSGCGIKLQTANPKKVGYIDPLKAEESELCQRCFRIKNYGDYQVIDKNNGDYLNILKNINKTEDLVLYVVDLLNLNLDLLKIDNPILLVLTKRDLLPKSVKDEKLLTYVKDLALEHNIQDYIITSSNKNYKLDELYAMISKYKKSNDVYVVGYTNAGKSSLINKIIKNYSQKQTSITTSLLPSTTLDIMEIKLSEELTLIDTPGLLDDTNINNYVDISTLKTLTPKKELKPKTYQMKPNQSVFVNDIVRVDYLGITPNSFTFYLSNELELERCNTKTTDRLYTRLVKHELDVVSNQDIVINGLGWIKITEPTKINLYTLKDVKVNVRKSLI